MNERISDPPTFQLPSWEGIARLLAATPRSRHLFCTHVDLTNAFWSFRLPTEMRVAFRFRSRPGGQVFAVDRLPFGCKFSPIFCQRILGNLVRPVPPPPPPMELLHYLDDFLIVGSNLEEVQAVTDRIGEALRAASFIVSQNSTLQLVQKICFLGKWLDLEAREIRSHPRAFLRMFHAWARLACKSRPNSRLMPKMLGFLQWHVRPRVGAGPLLAGAYCHERWGSDRLPTPIRVLHSLVTVMTRCAEPWRPPSHHTFGIARAMFVDQMSVPEFFGPSIFVDAAWDGFGCAVATHGVASSGASDRGHAGPVDFRATVRGMGGSSPPAGGGDRPGRTPRAGHAAEQPRRQGPGPAPPLPPSLVEGEGGGVLYLSLSSHHSEGGVSLPYIWLQGTPAVVWRVAGFFRPKES